MDKRPGGGLAGRPLHFIWIADCSGSMQADGKIQALNNAIREAIPHLRDLAARNPHAQILVRALAFSSGTRWHVSEPTPVEKLVWPDLVAYGYTDLGAALKTGAPGAARSAYIALVGDMVKPAWKEFGHGLRTGDTGFDKAHCKGLFQYLQANPGNAQIFS